MKENTLDIKTATPEDFDRCIKKYGWVLYDSVLDQEFINRVNKELPEVYEKRRKIQVENGIAAVTDGTAHHVIEQNNFAMEFLSRAYFDKEMKHFLGGNYIVNSFGGLSNPKNSKTYVQNVHRDVRSFTGDLKMMINMLVFIDDFTLENGATHLLTASHNQPVKPDDEFFFANVDRATGKKGSIVLFDSHLWHATGENKTDLPRRALAMTYTRPYFKQQLDYPRYLGYEFGETLNETLRQIIGYNARVPADLVEYYQPVEKRMYKQGQG